MLIDALVAVILLALPLTLFWSVTVGNRTLIPADNLIVYEPWKSAATTLGAQPPPHNLLLSDLVLENYLWKRFFRESITSGQLPLWNPYLFAGTPFLATGQHSGLYPFAILHFVLPLARSYGIFTVAQFFCAGLFAYVFLRVLGLRRFAAAFGAIVYELCLFMVVSAVFPMIIAGVVWLPLILTCLELIAREATVPDGQRRIVRWVALGAIALGCQILAGHIEITYYTLLVASAFGLWRLATLFRSFPAWPLGSANAQGSASRLEPATTLPVLIRATVAMASLGLLGLLLAGIQLVPLFELAQTSFRSGRASFEQIVGWSYPWRHALLFLVPNLYGNPSHHAYFDLFSWTWTPAIVNVLGQPIDTIDWGQAPFKNYVEGGAYLGLLPLLLAPVGVSGWWWQRTRGQDRASAPIDRPPPVPYSTVPFFALLALLALVFVFPTRLYALIFWLPGLNQVHSPFRWVWPLALSVAVLSAAGFDQLLAQPASPFRWSRRITGISRRFCLGLEPSLPAFLAGGAVWAGTCLWVALVVMRVSFAAIRPWADGFVQEITYAQHIFADGQVFFSYTALWVASLATGLLLSGLVLRLSQSRIQLFGQPAWAPAALVVLSLDLLVAGWGFNSAADPQLLEYVPPSAEFLRQDSGLWRFTTYDTRGAKPYHANLGWYFGFEDIRGYDSLFTRWYAEYMGLIEPQTELLSNRIAPIGNALPLDSPLLDMLNVKYVISEEEISSDKYTEVYHGEVRIYRNETAMPRAFVLPQSATLAVDNLAAAVQQFDPRRYVMVAPADALGIEFALPAEPVAAQVIQHEPNEVVIAALVQEPSWLILADAYFPGWRVEANRNGSQEEFDLEVIRVYGTLRAVALPPGDWELRFVYAPDSFRLGGLLTLTTGSLLAGLLGISLLGQRHNGKALR